MKIKTLMVLSFILSAILFLMLLVANADEIMLVGGELDFVPSYYEPMALTSIVRGKVTDQYGYRVNTGTIRSNGVCATSVTRGEYLCSEVYGSWTYRFRASGYNSKTFSVNVDSSSERKDIRVTCDDADYDGVCDIDDNCPHVPNGPRAGICKQKECSVFVKTCDRDSCKCDCLLNQEIDPCWCD